MKGFVLVLILNIVININASSQLQGQAKIDSLFDVKRDSIKKIYDSKMNQELDKIMQEKQSLNN